MKKKRAIDFKYNMHLYWSLLKNYKLLFFGLILLTFLLEGGYFLNRYLFKIVIDNGTEFASKNLPQPAFIKILLAVLIAYMLLITFNAVGRWLKVHLLNILETNLILDLKRKFFNHLIHLSYNFYTSNKTGALISRLIRGGKAIENMTDIIIWQIAPMISAFIIVSFSFIYLDYVIALIIAGVMSAYIAYSLFMQKKTEKWNVQLNDTEDIERANISDIFTNIESIKYFGKEFNIKTKFLGLITDTKNSLRKFWGYFRYFDSGQGLIASTGTLLIVIVSVKQFIAGQITLGTVVFTYTTYGIITNELGNFVNGIRNFYRTMADFESLFQYHKIENEVKDIPDAKPLEIKHATIEFKSVGFNYEKRKMFRDFNLKIPENKKVALVGPSGSGKSTLVKLLYRFYDLQKGKILVDSHDISHFKQESLRAEMSVVPQECVLFDDTIYNNIRFSKPKASRAEVMEAIRFAQLDKFINRLPKKENTIVGERGIKLSGGEKQRVSIARAILANKKILVLDEATSSLDSQTEHEIQRDLQALMMDRTTLIIAHRLSTIMSADTIVVLDKGKIVQMGKHDELIKRDGLYRHLWNLQRGGYIG